MTQFSHIGGFPGALRGVLARAGAGVVILGLALFVSSCSGPTGSVFSSGASHINEESKFSVSAYGVAASPRVTTSRNVPKGGGRYVVGQPYRVAGKWYRPREDTSYDRVGVASWYGPNFHGRLTANGEIFDQFHLSAAHPTLPLPSYVRVQNLSNGRSIIVRVNDRGPFANNRLIDLSRRSAEVLGFIEQGTARVRVTYVGRAPIEGDDTRFLVASINAPGVDIPPSQSGPAGSPSIISRQNGGLFGAVASLFSYAGAEKGNEVVSQAHAAANAVAGVSPDLIAWKDAIENGQARADQGQMPLALGTFADQVQAREVARQFALLGAVNVSREGPGMFRLTMEALKPGVLASDVTALSETLNGNAGS